MTKPTKCLSAHLHFYALFKAHFWTCGNQIFIIIIIIIIIISNIIVVAVVVVITISILLILRIYFNNAQICTSIHPASNAIMTTMFLGTRICLRRWVSSIRTLLSYGWGALSLIDHSIWSIPVLIKTKTDFHFFPKRPRTPGHVIRPALFQSKGRLKSEIKSQQG